jgi:hypothetical protein
VLRDEPLDDNIYHVSYRFNNTIPNQITQRSTPYVPTTIVTARFAKFSLQYDF